MRDNNAEKEKMIWRFSYQMWNKRWLEGMFVATQEEIDWIEDKAINFGDKGNNGLDVVVRMDPEYFTMLNSDPEFVEQFQRTLKDTGNTPFVSLDREQYQEWESEFGKIYGVGVPVKDEEPEPPREPFEDQDSRVITYDDLTGDIFDYKYYDDGDHSEEMDKFLTEFEIILPSQNSYLLAEEVEFSGDSIECVHVIKRKSDGQLYGYKYYQSVSNGAWGSPNGKKHGVTDPEAHVWLPVTPFTITGYKFN
jgi:hypothetical protein